MTASRTAAPLLAFVAGLACVLGAWVFAAPETAGPDEPSHYVKAVALARGDVLGKPYTLKETRRIFTVRQAEQAVRSAREFTVPKGLGYASSFPCHAFKAQQKATCLRRDQAVRAPKGQSAGSGAYPPPHYLTPGLASLLATDRLSGVFLTRSAAALVCLALLAAAAWALYDRRRPALSLLAPALSITPMVMFLDATLSPSGTEVSASIAFLALLLRLSRETQPRLMMWTLAAIAGFVLALSRPEGLLFVAWNLLLAVWLAGPRRSLSLARLQPGGALQLAAGAGGGSLLALVWVRAVDLSAPISLSRAVEIAAGLPPQLPFIIQQEIGVFGWQDTFMPDSAYWLWLGMIVGVTGWALWRAAGRQRLLLAFTAVMTVGLVFLLGALIIDQYGFGMQGRYALPGAVALPLIAGEILLRRGPGGRERLVGLLASAMLALVAILHVIGFWSTARRYAIGADGPWYFFDLNRWSPPIGGWKPWFALLFLGALLLLVSAALGARRTADKPGPGAGGPVREDATAQPV